MKIGNVVLVDYEREDETEVDVLLEDGSIEVHLDGEPIAWIEVFDGRLNVHAYKVGENEPTTTVVKELD